MRFASTGSPAASLWSACCRLGCACRLGQAKRRPNTGEPRTCWVFGFASTQPTAPGSRGFTLIEALAAIVILALALSALLSAHDTGLRGATTIDDHLQARLLAQSLLAQWSLERTPQPPSQGRSGRFAWSVTIAPYAGGTLHRQPGNWMLHELTVTVAWPPRRQVQLSTLRAHERAMTRPSAKRPSAKRSSATPSATSRGGRQSGVTLIEIVVALALVGLHAGDRRGRPAPAGA